MTYPIMNDFGSKMTLLNSEEECIDGVAYILNTYDIENYGPAFYAKIKGRTDGEFRKTRAMIPFEYLDKRAKDFDWTIYRCDVSAQKKIANAFIVNFERFQEEGKGLYIYSNTKGSGKTFLASCLLNELIDSRPINAKFITVLDLIEMTKKGFGNNEIRDEVDGVFNCRLLVLDDFGAEMAKEWTDTVLYRLLNHRTTKKLVTVFTSNTSIEKLKVNERITSRIFKMTIPLIMPEISIRNQKAKEENKRFLEDIING